MPTGRRASLPASVTAKPLTNFSLQQALQKGPQIGGEGVWEFYVLGRRDHSFKSASMDMMPAQPPRVKRPFLD